MWCCLTQAAQLPEGEQATPGDAADGEADAPAPSRAAPQAEEAPEDGDMTSMMMSRKTRKLYESVLKAKREKRARAATLMERSKRARTT